MQRTYFSATNKDDKDKIRRVENYIATIVSYLDTVLTQPEEEIINYGDVERDLYYISKGDCLVKLENSQGREYLSENILDEGSHFGEISMIYNCPRTATVISRTYNTLGKLTY